MSDPQAELSSGRRIPAIWLLPIIAILAGGWAVIYNLITEGPTITITFSTAEGIEAGQTKVKARSVDVGLVTGVMLDEDREHVTVTAKLDRSAVPLLRKDSRFWVVRPRINMTGVSGLSTVLSGGYIELSPGVSEESRWSFEGQEDIPITAAGTPGVHLTLVSRSAGSVSAGDPMSYQGYQVGRIERVEFDVHTQHIRYSVFIEAPFDGLVTEGTRFWNESGVSVNVSTEGVKVTTGSLQSLIVGGVSFDVPDGTEPGKRVADGAEFELYADQETAREQPYRYYAEYVVAFKHSIRGLRPGAPVEVRGIPIGHVERLLLDELVAQGVEGADEALPVLIRVEPGRVHMGDDPNAVQQIERAFETAVAKGLRVSLEAGNLLTGRLYVAMDYYPGEPAAKIGEFEGYRTLPTISTGLAQIERKVTNLLDKANALPLETTITSINASLHQLDKTLASANLAVQRIAKVAGSEGVQDAPKALHETLIELRQTIEGFSTNSPLYSALNRSVTELNHTLQRLQNLAQTLEEKPSSLIFPTPPQHDPIPGGAER